MTQFRELGVSEPTLRGLAAMGFDEPTPIQARAIPCLLAGRDIIAQALTGTGKTAAFGVPLVDRVDPAQKSPQAVVLTPTRELAIQVTDHLAKIGHERRIVVLPIYGGQPIGRQLYALRRGVQVVVATPGRLLDHLRRETIDLSGVRTLVLDEADQMLEMGFIEDVESIVDRVPADRVTALFSATMPQPIVDLAGKHLRDPETIQLSAPQHLTAPEIDQAYVVVPFVRKMDALCRILDVRQPERAIVFCATKRMVDEAVEGLTARGYQTEALHGDVTQAQRERVLRAFRNGQFEVLVATDVAARGLDVPEVSHVINFDVPPDPEYYVHRIGRTGRFGRSGVAITFVNPREVRVLKLIERATGARIRREEIPTAAEAEQRELEILTERLLTALAKGGWGRYRPAVEELLDDHDAVDVAAAALGLLASGGSGARRTVRAVIGPVSAVHHARVGAAGTSRPGVPIHETAVADVADRAVAADATDAPVAEDGTRPPARRADPRSDGEERPRPTRRPATRGAGDGSSGRRPFGPNGWDRARRADDASGRKQGPSQSPRRRDAGQFQTQAPDRSERRQGTRGDLSVPSWDEIRAVVERGSAPARATGGKPARDGESPTSGPRTTKGGAKSGKGATGGFKAGAGSFQLPASKKGRKAVSLGGLKARRAAGPARGGRGSGRRP